MAAFRQISLEEWKPGDYRAGALLHRKSDELPKKQKVKFHYYFEEGLGKAKSTFFLTSDNRKFFVRELLESTTPITEIWILNNPETFTSDLTEVLSLLDLNFSDLEFVYK